MNTSVLIPAYQPDEVLLQLVRELHAHDFSIVVVDDGSGADYAPLFQSLLPYAQVLSYAKNGGKGFALKYGMRYLEKCGCDVFITADADGQHAVKDILRVRDELEAGATFVLTTRTLHGKNIPFRSRFGNALSRFVCALTGGYYLADNQSGLRGFTAAYLPWLCNISGDKYDYEMNVLLYAERQELPILCLPIETIYLNDNQNSHFDPVKDTLRIYLRVICTARVSLAMGLLHSVLIATVSVLIGWNYTIFTIPGAAIFVATVGYLCNRFIVFRGLRYGCGPRTFIITALRTMARYSLCCVLDALLTIPLFPAWLIAAFLTVPLEYACLCLQGIWYNYRAAQRH